MAQVISKNINITYLKSIGIILMVIGHCGCGVPYVKQFIYMFHMPLFFFVSGFCFKEYYLSAPGKFLWQRVKGLYFPFIKWSVIFLLLHNFLLSINIYNTQFGFNGHAPYYYSFDWMLYLLKHLVFCMMQKDELMLGGYWFLNALFYASIFSWAIIKVSRKYLIVSLIIVLGICLSISVYGKSISFLEISSNQFAATFIFLIGFCFQKYKIRLFHPLLSLMCLLVTFVGSFFWGMEMATWFYDVYRLIPYLITAILSTWSIYSLLNCHKKGSELFGRIFEFIGNNTLTILTWHLLAFKIVSLLIIYIYNLPIENLGEFPVIAEYSRQGWWILYCIVSLLTTCTLAYCNKFIKLSFFRL